MSMIVKFMSRESRIADTDNRKSFRIVADVQDIDFGRNDKAEPLYTMVRPPLMPGLDCVVEQSTVLGDVYVMNEAGKTIASFNPAPLEAREAEFVNTLCLPMAVASDVVNTLDCLGLALVEHKHHWTPEQRRAYDLSIRALGAGPEHVPSYDPQADAVFNQR